MLEKIRNENKDFFDTIQQIDKLNVGFTNDVYSLDNKYILKVCKDLSNEKRFNNEIDFYIKNASSNYIPEMILYHRAENDKDQSYIILEKLSGKSLYYVWHTFSSTERENVVHEIANLMKSIHSNEGGSKDWSKYITDKIKKNLEICKNENILDDDICDKGFKVVGEADKYLESSEFSLIHSDIHFDNLIYTDAGEIKIIDFETSIFAPIDYELDIFIRMCNNPLKYASEETEPLVKVQDYENIEKQLRQFYPEIFSQKYYEIRMKYYDFEANLRLLPRFRTDNELKDIVTKTINELDNLIS